MTTDDRQNEIDNRRHAINEQALRRQWTIDESKAKAQKPNWYDLIEAIEKDENGEPLTRNERRILAALDKRIARDERRKCI